MLRSRPQALVTEAVALMLGRPRRDPEFLGGVLGAGRAVADALAGTWWDLVESLQGLHRPEGRAAPDWASMIHLAVAPVHYQSYPLGELLASQLDQAVREHAGGFVGRPATGRPLGPAAFLTGLAG